MYNDFTIIKSLAKGLLPEPKRDSRDYVLGAISKQGIVRDRQILKTDGHGWKIESPTNDYQRLADGDSNGCVSFSTVNAVQYSVDDLMKNSKMAKAFLAQESYIDENKRFEANNRIVVVGSNTDPNAGNSVTVVAEFVRKNGLAPMSAWPWDNTMTRGEFYNNRRVPREIIDKGLPFLKLFGIEHEWVPTDKSFNQFSQVSTPAQLINALKYGTPTVSVDGNYERGGDGLICAMPSGIYNTTEGKLYYWNHRITLVDYSWNNWWECHDHYSNQFIKFAWNYPLGNPKLYFITLKTMPQLYKKKDEPAIYAKHCSEDLLIPFADGAISGGDLFKTLYGVERYSDLPRIDVAELPYPVANYSFLSK